ncbi:MAG TPA: hypothetical protein VFZ61_16715, partial [Polyangiales bacterium]
LGWLLFHGLPGLLDGALVTREMARGDLGATPYFSALYAFVNIHHFLMDAVLWRRDNPAMRYLHLSQQGNAHARNDGTAPEPARAALAIDVAP